MTNLIRQCFKSTVIKNGMWLYVLQLFNTLVPLLTLPYIIRILGSEQYGVFAYALNIVGYFLVFVEYGFNLSGSRKVVMAKDKPEIEKIYSSIMICKLVLCIGSLLLLLLIGKIIGVNEKLLYSMLILYLMVIGLALQQTWLFQGLQNMKFITIINVISRTSSVLAIFLFIKTQNQVYLYCFLYAITFLLNGIISIIIVSRNFKLRFKKVNRDAIYEEFRDGWDIFITNAMSKIFSGFGITILGLVSTQSNVGIYSAMQKIPTALALLYYPIGQAIYPYVSKYYEQSIDLGVDIVRKICLIVLPIVLIICLSLMVGAKSVVGILFGDEYGAFSSLLIPLMTWMFFSIVNNFLGVQILVASGYQKEYSTAFKIGLIALIGINILMGYLGGIYGVAVAAMAAEIVLTVALIYQIRRIVDSRKECQWKKTLSN
jgi:PST family polysaccharide transporter